MKKIILLTVLLFGMAASYAMVEPAQYDDPIITGEPQPQGDPVSTGGGGLSDPDVPEYPYGPEAFLSNKPELAIWCASLGGYLSNKCYVNGVPVRWPH